MNLRTFATAAGLLALLSASAHAQAYRPTFATQIKLAGSMTDPHHTITIAAPSLLTTDGGAAWTLTLPSTAGTSGYFLKTDGLGNLSWANPATTVTLNGDVTGSAGSNSIASSAGNDIVAALNNAATTSPINTPVSLAATSLTTGGTLGVTGTATFGASPTTAGSLALYDANAHIGTIQPLSNLTGPQTYTLPAKSGTFAMLSDLTGGTTNVYFNTLTLGSLTTGGLVQSAPTTGVVSNGDLSGDVITTGTLASAINNTVAAGNHIVAALNSPATANSLNADVLNYDATLQVTTHALGLNLAHANAWAPSSGVNSITGASGVDILDLKANGGATQFALGSAGALTLPHYSTAGVLHNDATGLVGSSLIVNADVSATAAIAGTKITPNFGNQTIVTGDGTHAGSIQIYDPNGHTGTISTGGVNLTSTQTYYLPAKSGTFAMLSDLTGGSGTGSFSTLAVGSLTTGGLVQSAAGTGVVSNGDLSGDVLTSGTLASAINNTVAAGNHIVAALNAPATAASMNADVLKHDVTLQVTTNQIGLNLGQANNWTGTQAFGGFGLTQAGTTISFNGDQLELLVPSSNSYFFMSNASATTGNVQGLGLSAGTPVSGRMIVLVNSGANPITLVHMSPTAPAGSQFDMGGNVIIDASGSVTLIYDGADWHLISAN